MLENDKTTFPENMIILTNVELSIFSYFNNAKILSYE